jgi:hypothetical protein
VADLNGDGKLDIAVISQNFPVVTVILGKGDGTFGQPMSLPPTHMSTFILAADFDGDGHIDLATSNEDGSATVYWGGTGGGSFGNSVSYDVKGGLDAGEGFWLAAADLNGDGALDLVVSFYGSYSPDPSAPGHVAVLLNAGGRSFAHPVFYADRAAVAVVAGDLDGDGKLDVATANFDSTVRVFLGDGKGGLGPPTEYPIDGQGVAIEAGDFNRDGILDLATGNDRAFSASVLLGLGHGKFGSAVRFAAGNTHAVAVVDLDRDGHLDLLAGGYDERFVRFVRGKGDGTFFSEIRIPTSYSDVRGLAVADFNGDGKLDLAVADNGASVFVFIGN